MENIANCPFCKSDIPKDAEICFQCGERIIGKVCDDCRAICPQDSKKCRWCGYKFGESTKRIGIDEFEIIAKSLPTFLFRFRLLCECIRFNEEKIIVSTPGFFRLWVNEAEVPWNKVAGFDYRSGTVDPALPQL